MIARSGIDDRELVEVLTDRAGRAMRDDDQVLLAAVVTRVRATRQDRLRPRIPIRWERVAWVASVAAALVIGLGLGVSGPRWLGVVGSTATPLGTVGAAPSATLTFPPRSQVPIPSSWLPDGAAIPLLPGQLAAAIPRGRDNC
jgi:hypothetical protein